MSYAVSGPDGWRGGRDIWTSSPTEAVMGGIISAWNMSVVEESLSVLSTRAISSEETAGNSSTYYFY